MIRQRIGLRYRLRLETACRCGSGMSRGLVDQAIVLDERRQPYLPGSTIKGIVREHCERLLRLSGVSVPVTNEDRADLMALGKAVPDLVASIFGSRRFPGRLLFDDCRLGAPADSQPDDAADRAAAATRLLVTTRSRVSLSRLTRRAADGRLFSAESARAGLVLHGAIRGVVRGLRLDEMVDDCPPWVSDALLLLLAGLLCVDRVGGGRSSGSGAVTLALDELRVDDTTLSPAEMVAGLDAALLGDGLVACGLLREELA